MCNGKPQAIRADNGPEMTSQSVADGGYGRERLIGVNEDRPHKSLEDVQTGVCLFRIGKRNVSSYKPPTGRGSQRVHQDNGVPDDMSSLCSIRFKNPGSKASQRITVTKGVSTKKLNWYANAIASSCQPAMWVVICALAPP